MCSPETVNVPMPEDIDDFDPGPVYSWISGRTRKKSKSISSKVNGVHRSSNPLVQNGSEETER